MQGVDVRKIEGDTSAARVFVLQAGANRNRRTIYTDGRKHVGQLAGNDDNPLFYGHGVARWEGDRLTVWTGTS